MRYRSGSTTKTFHSTIAVSEETLRLVHDLAWKYDAKGATIVRTLVEAASDGRIDLGLLNAEWRD